MRSHGREDIRSLSFWKTAKHFARNARGQSIVESLGQLLSVTMADGRRLARKSATASNTKRVAIVGPQSRKGGPANDHRQPHPRPAHGQLVRILASDGRPIR